MPAQTNATITQKMSDKQPDIDSMILSSHQDKWQKYHIIFPIFPWYFIFSS